jgi:hypothetical protein
MGRKWLERGLYLPKTAENVGLFLPFGGGLITILVVGPYIVTLPLQYRYTIQITKDYNILSVRYRRSL